MKRSIVALLVIFIFFSTQAKYYEGIKEPQNALDLIVLFQQAEEGGCSEERRAEKGVNGPSVKDLQISTDYGQDMVVSVPFIGAAITLAQSKAKNFDATLEKLKQNYFTYRTDDNSFAIFLNKKMHLDAVLENGMLDLEKIGLNKNLKIVDWQTKKPLESLKKVFGMQKPGRINMPEFYSIFPNKREAIKTPKRFFVVGHGRYDSAILAKSGISLEVKPKEGGIVNLFPDQYIEFLTYLAKIGCKFLTVKTCYGAGWNQLSVHLKSLENLRLNKDVPFATVFLGAPDAPATLFVEKRPDLFLKDLHLFLTKQVKGDWKKWLKNNPFLLDVGISKKWAEKKKMMPLGQVLKHISREDPYGQPYVHFPGTNFFRAVSTTEKIKIITHPILLRYEILMGKGSPYIIEANTWYILIYPGIVMLPLDLKTDPTDPPYIIPMIAGPSQLYLESIVQGHPETKSDLQVFLKNIPKLKGRISPKLFFIANVTLKNHIPIGYGHILPYPPMVESGETLNLKNVVIKANPSKLKMQPEYLCKNPKTGRYYYALFDPKGNPKINFEPIPRREAEQKIALWIHETTPAPGALAETKFETSKKFRTMVEKNLKLANLEKEIESQARRKQEGYRKLVKSINQAGLEFLLAAATVERSVTYLLQLLTEVQKRENGSLEFLKKAATNRDLYSELQDKKKLLKNATQSLLKIVEQLPLRESALRARILKFLKTAPAICDDLLVSLNIIIINFLFPVTWKDLCKKSQQATERIFFYDREVKRWQKGRALRAVLPDTLSIKKALENLYQKTLNAILLFRDVTCEKAEQETKKEKNEKKGKN